MALPLKTPFPPMEAQSAEEMPTGDGWQYEPKWDGFRCLAFRDGASVELQSRAGKPLTRYFPEVAGTLRALGARRFVLDGEIVIPHGRTLSFDDLLQRIHPAESRVRKLAQETPAALILFDLLVDERGKLLTTQPLSTRRAALENFAHKFLRKHPSIWVSPATPDFKTAKRWFKKIGGLDGVVAKRSDEPYTPGERSMLKIKQRRTADCVVGGFRYASKRRVVGSLLLGLYDAAGLLHHVGFASNVPAADKPAVTKKLERLRKPPGFTGQAPGGPSRWSTERSTKWEPLRPTLVVEVGYDHFTGGRFRHGTNLLRWRPDKDPKACTLKQVARESRSALDLLD